MAIVGAGPTGLACGIELKRRGIDAVLYDKGCVVNSLFHYPTNMVFFTTPELLEIGGIPMTSIGEKPVRTEALKYYRRVADHYQLDIRQYERVDRVEGSDNSFVVHSIDRLGCPHRLHARKIILSTGYYDKPNYLNVPGEELPKVIHYYREAHPFYNHEVAVIGGKNSAAIAALVLGRIIVLRLRRGEDDVLSGWVRIGAIAGLAGIAAQSLLEFSLQMPGNAVVCVLLVAIALHRPRRSPMERDAHRV